MAKMTTHERFKRMYEHKAADRIPIQDSPWGSTIERWQKEGLPKDVDWVDFFDLDHTAHIGADNSPRYPVKTIEETKEYTVTTTAWGVTYKNWKHATSTPEYVDFVIKDPKSWKKAKARMKPSKDRINWDFLKKNYKTWRERGYWIEAGLWFGFDVTHARIAGTERILLAMLEDPEWCMDMFNYCLDINLALFDMIWDAGYHFDCTMWWDDMGYKGKQFFSLDTYRNVLKPVHKRAVEWAHAKGTKARLHSCGNINPLIPELIDIGVDGLNPLEVKAGMDPIQIKQDYGKKLLLHGGINAVLWDDRAAIEAEMRKTIPVLKQDGGYVFASDHSIPDSVSLENFRGIVELAKQLGTY